MSQITVSVDLRASFGPARNQGARPTCLAFAVSDTHAAVRGAWAPLSCEYAFYHAQRRAGLPPSGGARLSAMLEALRKDGQPEESGWPYLSATPTDPASWVPPVNAGELFGRNGVAATHSIDRIIQELDQGRPMIILLMLSPSFYRPTAEGIVDPAPGEQPEPARRHAVIAAGHGIIDKQRAILIRNSWVPHWGVAGYAWLTEAFAGPRLYAAANLLEDVNVSSRSAAA